MGEGGICCLQSQAKLKNKKQVLRKVNGSVTFRPIRNLWQTDGPSDKPTDRRTEVAWKITGLLNSYLSTSTNAFETSKFSCIDKAWKYFSKLMKS